MDIGIVDYLLRVREEACFYMAQELGFDCLELSVDQLGDPTRLLFDQQRPNDLEDFIRTTGVRVASLYATQFYKESLLRPDDLRQRPPLDALHELAQHASRLRIPTIVLPLFGASEVRTDADREALEALLEQAAGWGPIHKVRFAVKCTMAVETMVPLVQRFNSPWVGVCFDPANSAALRRDPVRDVHLLGPNILHVHLKDRTAAGDGSPLGGGILDTPAVLAALAALGYAGPIILETPSRDSAIESAKLNLQFCRRALAA